MKLSVIYQYSDDIDAVKDIMNQLTDETELIIMTSKMSRQLKETENGNVKTVNSSRLKTALSKAQGEFISFICNGDKVTDNYVKSILNAIADGDSVDYIPLKYRLVNWHGFQFTGNYPVWRLFVNVYKAELAERLDYSEKGRITNAGLMCEYIAGKPIQDTIYMHWRRYNE